VNQSVGGIQVKGPGSTHACRRRKNRSLLYMVIDCGTNCLREEEGGNHCYTDAMGIHSALQFNDPGVSSLDKQRRGEDA